MEKLKEKIFGVIVIIALGVIFVPMLWNNTEKQSRPLVKNLPEPPAQPEAKLTKKPEVLSQLKENSSSRAEEQDLSLTHNIESGVNAAELAPVNDEAKQAAKAQAESEQARSKQAAEAEILKQAQAEQAAAKAKADSEALKQAQAEQVAAKAKAESEALKQAQAEQAAAKAKAESEALKQAQAEKSAEKAAVNAKQASDLPAKGEVVAQAQAEQLSKAQGSEISVSNEKKQESLHHKKSQEKADPSLRFVHAGWVVQLGSFANPENAALLLKKLRKAGYPAYKRGDEQTEDLTVVFVGPKAKKEDAMKLRNNLESKYHLSGMVVRYEP